MMKRHPPRRSELRWWMAALTGLALALAACRRAPARAPVEPLPRLGSVQVTLLSDSDAKPGLDRAALADRVRTRLLALFAPALPDATGPLANVRVDVASEFVSVPGKTAARARARLRIDIHPEGSAAPRFRENGEFQAERTSTPEAALTTLRGLVEQSLDDLVGAYLARQRLWLGDVNQVKAALEGGGGELRLEAIRVVAERRLLDQVPALLRLLSDEDEVTRDTALGALVRLRERRAVAELTRSRSMRDRRELRKIIDAVAAIGGKEATDYLSFVADAHEDEELRIMARAALQRLARNAADAP